MSALTEEEIALLYSYGNGEGNAGRLLRSQYASSIVSPCAKYLSANPGATDNTYNLPVGDAAGATLPFFCDMSGGGWTLVYKENDGITGGTVTTGAAEDRYREAVDLGGLNDTDTTLLNRTKNTTKDYASRLLRATRQFASAHPRTDRRQ